MKGFGTRHGDGSFASLSCMRYEQQKYWNRTMVAVAVLLGVVAVAVLAVSARAARGLSEMSKRCEQCRNIVMALKGFAGDYSGSYPDVGRFIDPNTSEIVEIESTGPKTARIVTPGFEHLIGPKSSNQVFRRLFVHGWIDDETSFGGHGSPFLADGDIGTSPGFTRAVGRSENHWAMTAGMSDSTHGFLPLVYEHVVDETWPPRWVHVDRQAPVLGQLQRKGRVVVGRNDGSVAVEKLKPQSGGIWILKDAARLADPRFSDLRVLNAER